MLLCHSGLYQYEFEFEFEFSKSHCFYLVNF